MIVYDAVALFREQRRALATGATIEDCRDAVSTHHKKSGLPTLRWATCYFGLVAMTEDGESPLSPFIIRYIVEARDA